MKNTVKLFGIIALVAVIGLSFADCDLGSDDDDNNNENTNNTNAEYGWYGNGSSSNFTIKNFTQLEGFGKIVAGDASWTDKDGKLHTIEQSDFRGKTVTLDADIDIGTKIWGGIGHNDTRNRAYPFYGTFNGNNKTISGLRGSFFRIIGENGIVKNIAFVDLNTVSGSLWLKGAMVEENRGMVQNISINGIARGSSGVVDDNYGIVENCNFSGTVSGGIVAINRNGGVVRNCYVTGNVSAGYLETGGIVLENQGIVENCYSTSNVTSTSNYVGGIVGRNFSMVKNCFATGDISGDQNVGGVVGLNSGGMIQNCYATGNVVGRQNVGGISGSGNTVQNCVALNPSISKKTSLLPLPSSSSTFGRVTGDGSGLLNNYGLIGILFQHDYAIIATSEANGKHGTDVEASDYNTQTWWATNLNWNFNSVWEWDSARNLPKLR
jgi:hypothetical protein